MTNPHITHDGTLDIAVGRNRKETSWRNQTMTWSALAARLAATHRTAETLAEYLAAKKPRQDEIKDIGGFVGGLLTGGRRKATSVLHRQLITLDADFAEPGFWEDFTLLYGNAALVYSTHKHEAKAPRLRLVMPLDRPVTPAEYEAIARRIASDVSIEAFDPTTFQPERLMYWPSTARDAEFVFEYQDGPWISADAVLARYHDWQDASQWPVSARVDKLVRRSMTKQGDPLDKPGIVGAFCRTYTIHEAIDTYLADTYAPCPGSDRYTYALGSTAGGLVTYDDKFAYSHHGTDPTSGKLCNAFDLVRLHLYGIKDEDAAEGTPIAKMPSYLAMLDLAAKDAKVKAQIVAEKTSGAGEDFRAMMDELDEAEEVEAVEVIDESWREKLEVDRKGNIFATIDNIVLIFRNDPYFRGRIAFDDFEKCEVAIRDLPWRKVDWSSRRLTDRDDANILHYLESAYGISSPPKTQAAMLVCAQHTVFHPVKEYLGGLTWDGTPRLETLLVDYMGAEDSEYTRTVTRKALVAAVARIYRPGVKFDNMLTLVGEQGLKKSQIFSVLGGRWFSDSFSFGMLSKNEIRASEQIQGVWIIENAELSGMAKAEIEAVKHFITKKEDRFRVAYGRRTEIFPRQCIFVATTNKTDFLRDTTGNRRFWPVAVHVQPPTKDVFRDLLQSEVDQIWAEAVSVFRAGETLYLDERLVVAAREVQDHHTEEHPWAGIVRNFLEQPVPESWGKMTRQDRLNWLYAGDDFSVDRPRGEYLRNRICVLELWYEALSKRDLIDERSATILRNIMATLPGWKMEPKQLRYGPYGHQRRGYLKDHGFADYVIKQVTEDDENRNNGGVTDRNDCYNDIF